MCRYYKVNFSYKANGKIVYGHDTTLDVSSRKAVETMERLYGDADGFRILEVFVDRDSCWNHVDVDTWDA